MTGPVRGRVRGPVRGPVRAVGWVAPLVVLVAACGLDGGSGGEDGDAERVRATVLGGAEDAVPRVAQALSATDVQAGASWFECMQNLAWKYDGYATITAPEGDPDQQLEAVRAALVEAGYTDATQVEDHVSVEKDGFGLDVSRSPARGEDAWALSFESECVPLSRADQELVDADPERELDLGP